jgi:hypothetical protein
VFLLDSCKLSKSLPLLLALLVVAQIDLASAFSWPLPLLTLLHLTPETNEACRGVCAGLGCSLDVLAGFQLLRILARRALAPSPNAHPGN